MTSYKNRYITHNIELVKIYKFYLKLSLAWFIINEINGKIIYDCNVISSVISSAAINFYVQ